jgi:hypothetical protein
MLGILKLVFKKITIFWYYSAEERELKVLDEFIAYKMRCVERL